jgi:UDP-glucose 4-epimerase
MKIVVTGGAGFIGSHLCEYLSANGDHVTVIDDLSSGYKENLASVIDTIDFYKKRVQDFDFFELDEVDAVVHLAAQVSVPVSIQDFAASSSSNLLGSINVLDFCRSRTVPLVYASSSAVYGNLNLGNDARHEIDVMSPYAADKYMMEVYADVAFKLYKTSSVGLRFYNVYGPRQDPSNAYSGVISIFTSRLMGGQSIFINGGSQSRDFIYVEDVVRAIVKAIGVVKKETLCTKANILTGRSVTIESIADMLIDLIGAKGEKIYRDLPVGDPKWSKGTTERMQGLLGGNLDEMVPIEEGLRSTVDFLKKMSERPI